MGNPFDNKDKKKFVICPLATKQDLREMEQRLTAILLVIASGDKQRLQTMIDGLKKSADDLQQAVNENKRNER